MTYGKHEYQKAMLKPRNIIFFSIKIPYIYSEMINLIILQIYNGRLIWVKGHAFI